MDQSCGYCGFPNNIEKSLECFACGHTPWKQHIPYLTDGRASHLEELVKFLGIEKDIRAELELDEDKK